MLVHIITNLLRVSVHNWSYYHWEDNPIYMFSNLSFTEGQYIKVYSWAVYEVVNSVNNK